MPRIRFASTIVCLLAAIAACSTAEAKNSATRGAVPTLPSTTPTTVNATTTASTEATETTTAVTVAVTTDPADSSTVTSEEGTPPRQVPVPDAVDRPADDTPSSPTDPPPDAPAAAPEPSTTDSSAVPPQEPVVDSSPAAPVDPGLPNLTAAFDHLTSGNAALSVTVWRDHAPLFGRAVGTDVGGSAVTTDTPMVLASVSKLITGATIARLAEAGTIDVDAPVPWDSIAIPHDPAWNDVTVRQLLDHSAGMPKAQDSWLNDPGSCAIPLAAAMSRPPTASRGEWLYSNGNYCALGLLIEAATGGSRSDAALRLVFDPIGVTGPHLTTDSPSPLDGPYEKGVARLERLGGAGTWMASTDDLAAMLDALAPADLETMAYPAIMADQYGWGHTGTVDGAKACAWVIEQGRTVLVAVVAGNRPSTGGRVCDALVPALASDLGIWFGQPHRLPA